MCFCMLVPAAAVAVEYQPHRTGPRAASCGELRSGCATGRNNKATNLPPNIPVQVVVYPKQVVGREIFALHYVNSENQSLSVLRIQIRIRKNPKLLLDMNLNTKKYEFGYRHYIF
jgi:hypothetical protein